MWETPTSETEVLQGPRSRYAEDATPKDTTKRYAWRSLHTRVGVHNNSDPEYYDELGDPVYAQTYMVSVNQVVKKKHLIQFPISVDLQKVRKPEKMPCPPVPLKADRGADVNLLNSSTFDKAIGDRLILQPSSLRMEAYGNSTVSVLGKFHAFLRWKNRIYKQLFYFTSANASPNLLSQDSCYMLGVLKPCYSVETSKRSSIQTLKQAEKQQTSMKRSISKDQLKGAPLRKEDILETYTDVFTGIGKFPGPLYKFKLKPNAKPARHTPEKSSNSPSRSISPRNQEFGASWHSWTRQRSHRMGKQFRYCREESWPTSQTRSSAKEKANDLFGPKRPEWGIVAWALLH